MGNNYSQKSNDNYNKKNIKVTSPVVTDSIKSMENGFPIDNFPDDILQTIFIHLSGNQLIHSCSLVSKRWKNIVHLQTLWKAKCESRGIYRPNIDVDIDYKKYFFFNPYNRNLLKNGNASDGYNHWTITANHGNHFKIEENKCSGAQPLSTIGDKALSRCWATSFHWCVKEQTIDLIKEGCHEDVLDRIKPKISVSEWTTARKDCASQYTMKVHLLNAEHKELASCDKENIVDQWVGKNWTQISHDFEDYPKGVRFIKFTHGGKDRQFWAGHYGPKFTGACVKFVFED